MFTVPFQDMFDDFDEETQNGGIMSYYSPVSTASQHGGSPQSVSSDLSQFSPGTFRIVFVVFFSISNSLSLSQYINICYYDDD